MINKILHMCISFKNNIRFLQCKGIELIHKTIRKQYYKGVHVKMSLFRSKSPAVYGAKQAGRD